MAFNMTQMPLLRAGLREIGEYLFPDPAFGINELGRVS
jgi:hypothetical protein